MQIHFFEEGPIVAQITEMEKSLLWMVSDQHAACGLEAHEMQDQLEFPSSTET